MAEFTVLGRVATGAHTQGLTASDSAVVPGTLKLEADVQGPDDGAGIQVGNVGASANTGNTIQIKSFTTTERDRLVAANGMEIYNSTLAKRQSRIAGTWAQAIHENLASEISGITAKAVPTTADFLLIEDAADSNNKKRITIADIRITESQVTDLTHTDADAIHDNVNGEINAITAKATPVGADVMVIEDSAASFAKKLVTLTNLFSALGGGGGLTDVAIQVFTSSGTYTPTSGMTKALVIVVGGGGGGGGADGTDTSMRAGGGGGGGGGCSWELVDSATIGASKSVTVGAAGTAGSSSGGNGGSGGTTTLASVNSATGGAGGSGVQTNIGSLGLGGLGGVGSSGNLNFDGDDGGIGAYDDNANFSSTRGGQGGGSFLGGGGRAGLQDGTTGSTSGTAGNNYGGGGSGAACINSTTGAAGGAGTTGVIVILEFIQ